MFCIAAFIILAIIGIFSVGYRRLAAQAWKCVARKTTFRKCDPTFKEEMKARLLGKLIVRRPVFARFLDKWIEVFAFLFVIMMIWSLAVGVRSGLNLYVYDTCDPADAASCALGSHGCSVPTLEPQFWPSLASGHPLVWVRSQTAQFTRTLNRLPDRIRRWHPSEYTSDSSSYYQRYVPDKRTALAIIDPGCEYSAQLFKNLMSAGVGTRYNLTYIAYPIPDPFRAGSYRFPHSYLVASYLQALRDHPLRNAPVPADWQLLDRIFTGQDPATGKSFLHEIDDSGYGTAQVEALLQRWLREIGYTPAQVQSIARAAESPSVRNHIAVECRIVKNQIKVVKIPVLLLGTRRFDGLVGPKRLG